MLKFVIIQHSTLSFSTITEPDSPFKYIVADRGNCGDVSNAIDNAKKFNSFEVAEYWINDYFQIHPRDTVTFSILPTYTNPFI